VGEDTGYGVGMKLNKRFKIGNVLSLFDGISCGQIALNRAGIQYENYYASEINKNAIKVTLDNYPNTIQLGDITKIRSKNIPSIDLLMGGSPCQGFSTIGNRTNFEHPESNLFFEYIRIKNECKPKWFLLENVMMKQEWQDIISEYIGAHPIMIDSALVSAQRRKRLYWTNIPFKNLPANKYIYLTDIMDLSIKTKGKIIDIYATATNNFHFVYPKFLCRQDIYKDKKRNEKSSVRIKMIKSNKATTILTRVEHYPLIKNNGLGFRYPTQNECERLQTVPEGYTKSVIYNRAIELLGNGWTVDVIVHILNGMRNTMIEKRNILNKRKKYLPYLLPIKE
jgi:site-specific DNA-cytosine methylase